jgi:hypothetical protein
MIEMVQSVDVDGHIIFRANGIVRHTPAQLAEALNVSEDQFVLRVDPVLWAAEQKKQRRHRPGQVRPFKSADDAFWDSYHGHRRFLLAALFFWPPSLPDHPGEMRRLRFRSCPHAMKLRVFGTHARQNVCSY